MGVIVAPGAPVEVGIVQVQTTPMVHTVGTLADGDREQTVDARPHLGAKLWILR